MLTIGVLNLRSFDGRMIMSLFKIDVNGTVRIQLHVYIDRPYLYTYIILCRHPYSGVYQAPIRAEWEIN